MLETNQIKELLTPIAKSNDVNIVSLKWLNDQKRKILEISILKNDNTINLDICSKMSHLFSTVLDDNPQMDIEYFLDVCSPGAERELVDDEIVSAIGSYVLAKLKDPKDGIADVTGVLIGASETEIVIEYMDKTKKRKVIIAPDNLAFIRLAVKI